MFLSIFCPTVAPTVTQEVKLLEELTEERKTQTNGGCADGLHLPATCKRGRIGNFDSRLACGAVSAKRKNCCQQRALRAKAIIWKKLPIFPVKRKVPKNLYYLNDF